MSELKRVEIKNLVPVVAKISTGKSKLLNTVYNINFLESKSGIGTKFINILKYNSKISKPIFYHLKVKKEGDKYIFFKDSSEIYEGEKNIIEANKIINKRLYNVKQIKYEDLFYMIELNSKPFIRDKEYLESHYLCDIPGLSEYQENQSNNQEKKEKEKNEEKKHHEEEENKILNENEKNEEIIKKAKEIGLVNNDIKKEIKTLDENLINEIPKEEEKKEDIKTEDDMFYEIEENDNKTYLTEIFKIIKDYIDGAIIILSRDTYTHIDNYKIIAQFHKVIQKPITNFLVILNKIDLSENPEYDIDQCKALFARYFPKFKTFNINLNTFVPISVNQLRNELLMKKDFKSLIYYHFYNYMAKFNKYKRCGNSAVNFTFIDHLRRIVQSIMQFTDLKNNGILSKVNDLNKSDDISKINNEIKSIIKDLKEEFKDRELNLGVYEKDFNDNENNNDDEESDDENDNKNDLKPSDIIKFYYICHKNGDKLLMPSISEESNNLINYFTNHNYNFQIKDNNNEEEENDETKLNKSIIKILKNINKKILNKSKLDITVIRGLFSEIQKTIDFLKIYNVILIPFIGASGSGKSSIINGIIGEEVLETGNNGTKKGFIIRYLKEDENEINIRKVNFKEETYINSINYYFESEKNIIGRGLNQVKEIVKALNHENDDEKEEDSFYYIRTKIKLFDDLGLNDSIKRIIYLIDLPGFGSNKKFETKILPKLMSICSCFIFVVKNTVIKEKEQQKILNEIFEQAKSEKHILTSALIKSSLFIFNIFDNSEEQDLNNKDIQQAKKDIMTIINNNDEKGKENDIKLCFFHANLYRKYFVNHLYFYNIKATIMAEYEQYLENNNEIFKNPETIKKLYNSFTNYLISNLDQKNKNLFNSKNKKDQKINKNVEKDLIEALQNIDIDMKEKLDNSNRIGRKFSYGQEQIEKIEYLKESGVNDLKSKLFSQIRNLNNNMQISLKKEIDKVIKTLDYFFSNTLLKERNYKEVENYTNKIEEVNKKFKEIYIKGQEDYFLLIENYQKKINNSLNQKLKNINQSLKDKNKNKIVQEINMEMENSLVELNQNINEYIEKLNKGLADLSKEANMAIEIFSNGKEKTLIDSNFKDYFASKVGGEGIDLTKELIEEIKIASSSTSKIFEEKGFAEWLISNFSSVKYLKNCIEIIIKTFTKKINYIFELLIRELTKYILSNYYLLESNLKLSATNFTEEQKKIFEELCKQYEDEKLKIKAHQEKLIKKEI